jgi:hypothetical protein
MHRPRALAHKWLDHPGDYFVYFVVRRSVVGFLAASLSCGSGVRSTHS